MSFSDEDDFQDAAPNKGSRSFLSILWQRKALVILGMLLGLVAGFLFYWQRPPVYQSSAQILVIKKRSDPMPIAGGDPRVSYVEDYMGTHMVLLKSPLIIERAIRKRDLTSMKTFEGSGDPVGQVLGSLVVSRDTKDPTLGSNNIIQLAFRGPVAEDCGKVINAIIDSYQDFLDSTYRNVSDQTLQLIEKARDVLKKDLADSEKEWVDFRQKTPIFWKSKDGLNMQLERVANIEKKRTDLYARKNELQA